MVFEPVLFDWQRGTEGDLWLIIAMLIIAIAADETASAIAADDTAMLPHQPSVAIILGTVQVSLRLTVFVAEPFDPGRDPLSFPKIISGRIDDANRTRLVWRRWSRIVGRLVLAARPCPIPKCVRVSL